MRGMKLVASAVVAIVALAAFGATSAFAGGLSEVTFEPFSGSFEVKGESTGTAAEKEQILENASTGVTISCATVETTGTATLTAPRTGSEKLLYKSCKDVQEPNCTIASTGKIGKGEIETNTLNEKLAFKTLANARAKEAKEGDSVTIFEPTGAAPKIFVTLETGGSGCQTALVNNLKVTGTEVLENRGAEWSEAAGKKTSHVLETSTRITKAFENETAAELKGLGLTAFGSGATYKGKVTVSSAGSNLGETWGVEG